MWLMWIFISFLQQKNCRTWTGSRSWRRRLRTTALVVLGTLCLFILLKTELPDKGQKNLQRLNNQPKVQTPESLMILHPKCERNLSASNVSGFSDLPHHIQNFLFYRHCRHFPMLLNVPDKCGGPQNSADVFLLLVIKSSPPNYDRREVLRKTWAMERLQSGVQIRTVFLSGTVGEGFEKLKLNKLLQHENREHQDILQWDFNDSFFNLTLKQILFMQWMERWCPNAHFLLNGDDDIFANTDNMVDYLKGLPGNDGSKHLFVGHLIQYVGPIRISGSKYYVPVQVHEPNMYPPYCGGGGFLLSCFTARTIYNMSHSVTLLPIDDVYMGMCLEKAGLKPVSHMGVKTAGLNFPSKKADKDDPCFYREMLLVHRFLPHQIYLMWHEIHKQYFSCGETPS